MLKSFGMVSHRNTEDMSPVTSSILDTSQRNTFVLSGRRFDHKQTPYPGGLNVNEIHRNKNSLIRDSESIYDR